MLIRAANVKVTLDAMLPENEAQLTTEIAQQIGVNHKRTRRIQIQRKSIDARKKSDVHFVLMVDADIEGIDSPDDLKRIHPKRGVSLAPAKEPVQLHIPNFDSLIKNTITTNDALLRPVIVGSGPCGMFCALYLARAGLNPILIERGKAVDERIQDVLAFASGEELNPNSNVQFGEGGAGTFSDGKLNTGTKSEFNRFVLEEFACAGAPADILVDAKPHIGTDCLQEAVRGLRQAIEKAGGEVRFQTRLDEIESEDLSQVNNRKVTGVHLTDLKTGSHYTEPCDIVVLAIGHSARDTFEMLNRVQIKMERKPFAVGVRIEHSQVLINEAQYGRFAGHPALPPADYKLATHNKDGRGVYTFCMCPGGSVVAAASERGGVCVNGMSDHARDGENANSALLVEIKPDDFKESEDILAGMRFQQFLEKTAYDAGFAKTGIPYSAPCERMEDYLNGKLQDNAPSEGKQTLTPISPTYPRGVAWCDLREVLPTFITEAYDEAIPNLAKKLKGFDAPYALMTAIEARSSSPVRMVRDHKTLEASGIEGLYPAGEGAGYAGGIMSAACDGLKVASAIAQKKAIECAAAIMRAGCPLVFPTDTVMGCGVSVKHADTPEVLFNAKGRPSSKPVAWLIGSANDLDVYGCDIPDYARELACKYWPGALTLVVKASSKVPVSFASAEGTIGLRMPNSKVALELIRLLGFPIAATSANRAGQKAATCLDELDMAWVEETNIAVLGLDNDCQINQENSSTHMQDTSSTVIDCTGLVPRVLRQGPIRI